ncbi:MAG: ABC transporter substrate-binding protein, partial [Pirellulales bacterium]
MQRTIWMQLAGVALTVCLVFSTGDANAQQPRLLDAEPFDRLTLKENSENKNDESKRILKLRPLELKKRRPVTRGDDEDRVRVRLFDRGDQQYEVAWKAIEKLELFEELLLQEVAGLVEQQRFDEAYDYFLYLEERDSRFPGVAEGLQNCLFTEAAAWRAKGELDQALGLLNEVHRRNADYPELEKALGETVDAAIEARLAAGQYEAARDLIKDLEKKFKEHPVVATRKQFIMDQAAEQLSAARAAAKAKKLREAYIAASKAVDWWPELPGAKTLLGQIQDRYRVITVGVADLGESRATSSGTSQADGWARQRQRRLLNYDLAESAEAPGEYRSALGTWSADGAKLGFTLHANARWTGGEPVTSYDVARRLQDLADPASANWRPQWNEQIAQLRITASNQLEIDLHGPRLLALANLATPPLVWRASADDPAQTGTGLYTLVSRG